MPPKPTRNLRVRVITALVGIPVLVAAIWWGSPWLTVLVAVAAVLGVREVYRLAPVHSSRLPVILGGLWAIAFVLGAQAASDTISLLRISLGVFLSGAFVGVLWLVAFYNPRRNPSQPPFKKGGEAPITFTRGGSHRLTPSKKAKRGFSEAWGNFRGAWGHWLAAGAYLIGAPLYVGFLLAHALALREVDGVDRLGRDLLLFSLLLAFAADTGAFFTGSSIGRHKMAPQISPSKTWEGAVGGFLLAVLAAAVLGQWLELGISTGQQIIVGAVVGVVAQLGDLLESKLKRVSHAKDAGSIIPGHGGILDRLDSIVFSIPSVYYLVVIVFH